MYRSVSQLGSIVAPVLAGMLAGACIFGGDDDDDGLLPLATDTPAAATNTVPPTETVAGATTAAATSTTTGETTYTVVAGDTLSAIARAHETTVEAIVAANNIADPDQIEVGQVLIIPDGSQ